MLRVSANFVWNFLRSCAAASRRFCNNPSAADYLKKRVLLVDLQMLEGSRSSRATKVFGNSPNEDGDIKAVFQEAELSDAVLFFDECEVIFAKREIGGNKILNLLLCELERYNGIVFLATNKPLDLDEAMHRRITSVYEFKAPDHCQRRLIWQSYATCVFRNENM